MAVPTRGARHNGVVDPIPRRPRRAVRPGTERDGVEGPSSDETAEGWNEGGSDARGESNDDRLRRDVPPHY